MIEIEARLGELKSMGLGRRVRMVSGPQGPHVVLDGKPVLLLCSDNYLGLADHPRVREAAAEAAMRWGVGAGASRLASGTMTVHRRLEERLAAFLHRESALLFGSGFLANAGVVAALARPGDVVFSDELNHASLIDGCRLSRAEVFVYDHGDVEHLAWGLGQAQGRGALIVSEAVFSMDGDVAPLEEIVELAERHRVRLLIDESHGIGALGPGGRGRARGARARGPRRRDPRHAREVARLLWRVRRVRSHDDAVPAERGPHADLLDRAVASGDRRRGGGAGAARGAARAWSPGCS